MEQEQQKRYRAWAEIDLNALTHNVQTVQNLSEIVHLLPHFLLEGCVEPQTLQTI